LHCVWQHDAPHAGQQCDSQHPPGLQQSAEQHEAVQQVPEQSTPAAAVCDDLRPEPGASETTAVRTVAAM
jgi:hypothetical protein